MPIENERKYVLRDYDVLLRRCRAEIPEQRLTQFYLSDEGRFRRVETEGSAAPVHLFTYKKATRGGLLEIETVIAPEDYALALGEAGLVLDKSRFDIRDGATLWSLDFLRNGDGVYFAMAEVEFEPGDEVRMPAILEGHVALAVPQADNLHFANSRLIDPDYAARALERYRAGA